MKKIHYLIPGILLILLLASCENNLQEQTLRVKSTLSSVEWISKESNFNDYKIKGNEVSFYCTLSLKNNGDKKESFYLIGDFSDDYKKGLVTKSNLYGVGEDNQKAVQTLNPKEKKSLTYIFKGKFAGNNKKTSRLCPEILIKQVKE